MRTYLSQVTICISTHTWRIFVPFYLFLCVSRILPPSKFATNQYLKIPPAIYILFLYLSPVLLLRDLYIYLCFYTNLSIYILTSTIKNQNQIQPCPVCRLAFFHNIFLPLPRFIFLILKSISKPNFFQTSKQIACKK